MAAETPVYLNQREVAARLGIGVRILRRWSGEADVFPPDVRVGPVLGWEPGRVAAFGRAAGLLDSDGQQRPRPPYMQVTAPAGNWQVPTRDLMGIVHIAQAWGRTPIEVLRLRRQHAAGFPEPVALISDVSGWAEEDIIRFGRQVGKLNPDGSIVPPRRTTRTLTSP